MAALPQNFPWKKKTGSAIAEKPFAIIKEELDMKVMIVSDTHGRDENLEIAVNLGSSF